MVNRQEKALAFALSLFQPHTDRHRHSLKKLSGLTDPSMLDKHSGWGCRGNIPSSKKKSLRVFISDGNAEFVFNLWLSQEHTSSSKNSLHYIKGDREWNSGSLSIMRSRCFTFAGSRILRRFGWRVIRAGAHVGGDAGTSLTFTLTLLPIVRTHPDECIAQTP